MYFTSFRFMTIISDAMIAEWREFLLTASPDEIEHETQPGAHFDWVMLGDEDEPA